MTEREEREREREREEERERERERRRGREICILLSQPPRRCSHARASGCVEVEVS